MILLPSQQLNCNQTNCGDKLVQFARAEPDSNSNLGVCTLTPVQPTVNGIRTVRCNLLLTSVQGNWINSSYPHFRHFQNCCGIHTKLVSLYTEFLKTKICSLLHFVREKVANVCEWIGFSPHIRGVGRGVSKASGNPLQFSVYNKVSAVAAN